MFASSWMDPVLGVDLHWEMVPTPAPVPTPFPNPYVGLVLDVGGLVGSVVMGGVMSAVFGVPFAGPVLHWFRPATNTGTESRHVAGHFVIPPGTIWAPVPRTPKPRIRPGETAVPAPPVKPENDAIAITGSKTVLIGGSNAVRLGDLQLSCSEPVRLPSSVTLAIPKGAPILIGGPPSLDLAATVLGSMRTRYVSDALHALVSRLAPGRFRNFLDRAVCFFTGHPVDVASGKVMTSAVEAELPGPLPLRIERVYSSAFGDRDGPLGHGWSLSLEQAIWTERGKVVLLDKDGREIEFDTFGLPDHRMRPGDRVWQPIERLELERLDDRRWRVTAIDRVTREFGPVAGRQDGRAVIQRTRSRCGHHEIAYEYDARGLLEWVRDACGRLIWLERDDAGRVRALKLPVPSGQGWFVHRRYGYDEQGDLVQVTDARGYSWRCEYQTHLLVRETDRTGLSFSFEYDGMGQDAWCTRTWGDGGIFDHRIAYDKVKKVTFVTNSRGHTTQYRMNVAGLVVSRVDPLGGETRYEYDPRTLRRAREVDALGGVTERTYDARGNLVRIHEPDGATVEVAYDDADLPVRATTSAGRTWSWSHDARGRLVERTTPAGERTRFGWSEGLLSSVDRGGGRRLSLRHDGQKNLASISSDEGTASTYAYDALGRMVRSRLPLGGASSLRYDIAGNLLREQTRTGLVQEIVWDAEDRPIEVRDASGCVRLRYGHFHKVVEREEASSVVRLAYDAEGDLTAVTNPAGERCLFTRDPAGRVMAETSFDGRTRRYRHDHLGRVLRVELPSGRSSEYAYDPVGRLLSSRHSDGTGSRFVHRAGGGVVRAENEYGVVVRELDDRGRVVREEHGGFSVRATMDVEGERSLLETSLGGRMVVLRDALGAAGALYFGTDGPRAGDPDLRIDRDLHGQETGRRWSTGLSVEWSRDAGGRPLSRTIERRRSGAPGVQLDARSYEWRSDDRLAALLQAGHEPIRYHHDASGALVAQTQGGRTLHRAMDAAGNVYRSSDRSDRRYGPGGRIDHAGEDRFELDEDGNLTARIGADGSRHRYHWNGAGLLRAVDLPDGRQVRFEYDALARRSRKEVVRRAPSGEEEVERDVRFVWDGHVVVHEVDRDEGITTWFWEPGTFAPVSKENDGRRWAVVNDHLGTPTAMYDELGALAWKMQLDVFGVPSVEVGAAEDCPWRWPGQYEDVETGLFYNRRRYYDPQLGTYCSRDPLGIAPSLSEYSYAPDPSGQIDPFGLASSSWGDKWKFVHYWGEDNLFHEQLEEAWHPSQGHHLDGNVAVVELEGGFRKFFLSGGEAGDSEVRMMAWLTEKKTPVSQIKIIYTELSPCDACFPKLQAFLGEHAKNVELHFSWFYTKFPPKSQVYERLRAHSERRARACKGAQ